MAIYVPDSTRRRRAFLLAAACLAGGLLLGGVVGRATAPGIDDQVREVRDQAASAATALQRLPIEYEQLLAGEGESSQTMSDAIDNARELLRAAYEKAVWFGAGAAAPTDAVLDALSDVVAEEGSAEEFTAAVDEAVQAIEQRFDIAVE